MDSLTMQATYSNCQASLSKFPGAAPTKSPSVSPNRITGGAWVASVHTTRSRFNREAGCTDDPSAVDSTGIPATAQKGPFALRELYLDLKMRMQVFFE